MAQISAFLFLGIFTSAYAVVAKLHACDNLRIDSEWGTGMSADLDVTSDHDGNGWTLEISWDKPISDFQQWSGSATASSDQKTFTIKGSGSISSGSTFSVRMVLGYASTPNLISAYLDGSDVCGGGSYDTTTTTPCGEPGPCPIFPTTQSTTTNDQGFKPDYPAKYDYGEAIDLSLQFYEAQRSGKLPSDNRVPWRGDSALDDAVPGGYYDAGDLVKFGFPMAATVTVLAWGGINFKGGLEAAGMTQRHSEAIKWGTDYFIGCHKSDYEFVGQIGDGYVDHAVWDSPENLNMPRPAFSITTSGPGSDLAGETASALAASSIWYRMLGESDYADECLQHAKVLFDFADKYRGKYTDTIPAGGFYESWSGYNDEIVWSAAWIAKATGEQSDIDKAEALWNEFGGGNANPSEVSWDDKWAMTFLLMYDITGKDEYKSKADDFLNYLLGLETTNLGLVWIGSSEWGSLRYAGNFAMFAMQAGYYGLQPEAAFKFAEQQMNYVLGDAGHSYVCGFGSNPPKRPHHRAASCPGPGQACGWDFYYSGDENKHDLKGALVGGPNRQDQWADDRTNYATNEVTTDYNAGFHTAIAGLNQAFNS